MRSTVVCGYNVPPVAGAGLELGLGLGAGVDPLLPAAVVMNEAGVQRELIKAGLPGTCVAQFAALPQVDGYAAAGSLDGMQACHHPTGHLPPTPQQPGCGGTQERQMHRRRKARPAPALLLPLPAYWTLLARCPRHTNLRAAARWWHSRRCCQGASSGRRRSRRRGRRSRWYRSGTGQPRSLSESWPARRPGGVVGLIMRRRTPRATRTAEERGLGWQPCTCAQFKRTANEDGISRA